MTSKYKLLKFPFLYRIKLYIKPSLALKCYIMIDRACLSQNRLLTQNEYFLEGLEVFVLWSRIMSLKKQEKITN
jgi:hypothetical protein